jgi:signal transduction histidine kinase
MLLICGMAGAVDYADALAQQFGASVEVAITRKAGLDALRRREYALVIVEESIAEGDPAGADLLWKHAGLAVPLQVNFALSNGSRLARDVRAALARRAHEQSLAMRAAASTLESELRATLTGLLLHSQLALADPALTPNLAEKLKVMNELASSIRQQLERPKA